MAMQAPLNRVANRHQAACHLVGNVDAESLFAGHHDFDDVEAVGSQIRGQPGGVSQSFFFASQVEH
jgi:hypothetical protein